MDFRYGLCHTRSVLATVAVVIGPPTMVPDDPRYSTLSWDLRRIRLTSPAAYRTDTTALGGRGRGGPYNGGGYVLRGVNMQVHEGGHSPRRWGRTGPRSRTLLSTMTRLLSRCLGQSACSAARPPSPRPGSGHGVVRCRKPQPVPQMTCARTSCWALHRSLGLADRRLATRARDVPQVTEWLGRKAGPPFRRQQRLWNSASPAADLAPAGLLDEPVQWACHRRYSSRVDAVRMMHAQGQDQSCWSSRNARAGLRRPPTGSSWRTGRSGWPAPGHEVLNHPERGALTWAARWADAQTP